MMMKEYRKWSVFVLTLGMAMLFGSCVVHRHPRPHRHRPHHPHRHRVVFIAEQTAVAGQAQDCITFEECLAMTEPESYGSTE